MWQFFRCALFCVVFEKKNQYGGYSVRVVNSGTKEISSETRDFDLTHSEGGRVRGFFVGVHEFCFVVLYTQQLKGTNSPSKPITCERQTAKL